jgi:hypothetical protein
MTDKTNNKRLRVSGEATTGLYLIVPLRQLDEVRTLLDSHSVRYWVDETAISLDGQPPAVFISFGRGTEGQQVQTILDSVA